ncbi:MAG: hypothetical protein J6P57_02375 [Lachnospiraceae bacterium]|nr:hypothetical protein [Lachnospiraceae bacterium]
MDNIGNIKWHPGFYGCIEYTLKEYKHDLIFDREYELSKEPTKMDLLIIKKKNNVIIDNPIGKIFRKYNIVEYKSPRDELSIDDLYKTIGYTGLFKGYGKTVDEIKVNEMTISIFRHTYPRELFKSLEKISARIEKKYSGIYYIYDIINIPLQIVVTKRLEKEKYAALRILTPNAEETEVRRFVKGINDLKDKDDKMNADAVLQVSVPSNQKLYQKIRGDGVMCEALKELFKDDIERTVNEAVNEAVVDTKDTEKKNFAMNMLNGKEPLAKITKYTDLSKEAVLELARKNGITVVN